MIQANGILATEAESCRSLPGYRGIMSRRPHGKSSHINSLATVDWAAQQIESRSI